MATPKSGSPKPFATKYPQPRAKSAAGSQASIGQAGAALSKVASHTGITVKHNNSRPKGV